MFANRLVIALAAALVFTGSSAALVRNAVLTAPPAVAAPRDDRDDHRHHRRVPAPAHVNHGHHYGQIANPGHHYGQYANVPRRHERPRDRKHDHDRNDRR